VNDLYTFIDANKASFSVLLMCACACVSRSGFYDWLTREESLTSRRRKELLALIKKAFVDSDGTYGYRRVHEQLRRWGKAVSPELVRRLMREADLRPCQPRPWRPVTTIAGDATGIPDLLQRNFTAERPGLAFIGDITYIRTLQGWLYLATVIDCCTKKCVGYAMADHMKTSLVIDALRMAVRNGHVKHNAIFHSDRGCQYTSQQFADWTREHHIRRSMGRTGVCWDNASAESFNSTVKTELVNRIVYATRRQAHQDVSRYIEIRYNTLRFHSALGYLTPQEFHDTFHTPETAA
jgi:putative transposase